MTNEKTKKNQPTVLVDLDALIGVAKERPDVVPKLDFGGKSDQVSYDVEFVSSSPRTIPYVSDFTGRPEACLVWDVKVLNASPNAAASVGEVFALFCQAGSDGKSLHGLTAGVLKLFDRHGRDLKHARARIRTRTYEHDRFGATKGYDVVELPSARSPLDPAAPKAG